MAPKKNVKMDLSSFLADDAFGSATDSWADEFDPDMLQNTTSTVDIGIELPSKEPVIPDEAPFTARIASFPDGTTEDELKDFFIDGLNLIEPEIVIEDFYCPKDMDGNLKPFAFITFNSRDLLVDALALNDKPIHNKPVYVSVAKPSKRERRPHNDGNRFSRGGGRDENYEDIDWSGARGSRAQRNPRDSREPRERRHEVEIDWDDVRSGKALPIRDNEERQFRGPPRERRGPPREDNFDWNSARGSLTQPEIQQRERSFKPRERREPREPREDNFDWNSARGSLTQPEVQERERSFKPRGEHRDYHNKEHKEHKEQNDSFDWGAARGSLVQKNETPRKSYKPKTDDFEWGARGSMLKKDQTSQQKSKSTKTEKKETPIDGPKKSIFSVLQNDDEDDDDEEEEEVQNKKEISKPSDETDKIVNATAELSLDDDESGWTIQK